MFDDMKKKFDAIDVMAIVLMGKANQLMPMMNGFVLEGQETYQFPRLVAMLLHDDKLSADQPDEVLQQYVDRAIEQINKNRETNKDVYSIPPELLKAKYKGCGNGIVTIEKGTRKVLDFDYTDSKFRVLHEQNMSMTKSAGKKIREDETTITYRANFSSCQVCLF
jgi:hypothetical protein